MKWSHTLNEGLGYVKTGLHVYATGKQLFQIGQAVIPMLIYHVPVSIASRLPSDTQAPRAGVSRDAKVREWFRAFHERRWSNDNDGTAAPLRSGTSISQELNTEPGESSSRPLSHSWSPSNGPMLWRGLWEKRTGA